MKDNLTDLNKFKHNKELKLKQEKELEKNTELFKEITGKNMLFLSIEEMNAYQEIGVVCRFSIKDTYSLAIAIFRGQMYVINHIGGKFEYLGTLEEVMERGIFGK